MFLSRNKKNNVYPCKPQFNYIKVGFNGVGVEGSKFYRYVFVMYLSRYIRKWTLEYVHPVKIQISLGIRAFWSDSSLSAFWIEPRTQRFFMRTTKTLIKLRWFESSLCAYIRRYFLSHWSYLDKYNTCINLDWFQSFLHFFFFFFFFFFFCHSLSLPGAVFVSLIPVHYFTTETIFSTMGHNLSNRYKLY